MSLLVVLVLEFERSLLLDVGYDKGASRSCWRGTEMTGHSGVN